MKRVIVEITDEGAKTLIDFCREYEGQPLLDLPQSVRSLFFLSNQRLGRIEDLLDDVTVVEIEEEN